MGFVCFKGCLCGNFYRHLYRKFTITGINLKYYFSNNRSEQFSRDTFIVNEKNRSSTKDLSHNRKQGSHGNSLNFQTILYTPFTHDSKFGSVPSVLYFSSRNDLKDCTKSRLRLRVHHPTCPVIKDTCFTVTCVKSSVKAPFTDTCTHIHLENLFEVLWFNYRWGTDSSYIIPNKRRCLKRSRLYLNEKNILNFVVRNYYQKLELLSKKDIVICPFDTLQSTNLKPTRSYYLSNGP